MILPPLDPDAARVRADMQHWLERAVIGLNLCPFARAVVARGQLHWAISDARDPASLQADLATEVESLLGQSSEQRDTTLLVAPDALPDFLDFHAVVGQVERWLRKRRLDGVLQVASFHPAFEFADEPPDAIGHFSNRAPYPTLHLLREDSIARAIEHVADPSAIYERNRATLQRLGPGGWQALGIARSLPQRDRSRSAPRGGRGEGA